MLIDYNKLQTECARRCYSMTEVLKRAHISTVTLQRIKIGKPVRIVTVGKLARAVGVDVAELIKE